MTKQLTQPTQPVTETITAEIFDELSDLPIEQHHEVLAFTRSLKLKAEGVAGASLLAFAGQIDATELDVMQEAITEGCEQIDLNEW